MECLNRLSASLQGRDVQPALGHQRQQADRLERDRLAAGVGPGDHQGVGLRVQLDVDGTTFSGSSSGWRAWYTGSACRDGEPFPRGWMGCRVGSVARTASAYLARAKARSRSAIVSTASRMSAACSPPGRKLGQDAPHLRPAPPAAARGTGCSDPPPQRLDEQGGPGGGLVVHDRAQLAFELGAQRHHIAPIALGDERFLQDRGSSGR
jgi:hypothetical protein